MTFILPQSSYLPHADEVVAVSGEERLAVSWPGERGADGRLPARAAGHLGAQLLHLVLALQVPHLDAGASGGTQPVPGTHTRTSEKK